MPSEKRIVAYLDDKDWELYKKAIKRYAMQESKFLKEIIHSWLFQNKLQLQDKK